MSDRDLFDDSTMTFGEHLEELRNRLILALYGTAVGAVVGFLIGGWVIGQIKEPLVRTLQYYEFDAEADAARNLSEEGGWTWIKRWMGLSLLDREDPDEPEAAKEDEGGLATAPDPNQTLRVDVPLRELLDAIKQADPDAIAPDLTQIDAGQVVPITLVSPFFAEVRQVMNDRARPVTLTVQEGFFTYLKVSLVVGVVLASPWIFYQAWQFVAAGLYPHERRYVYKFGPLSFGLFFLGAAFAWFAVIPFALDFFVGFSVRLGFEPTIQIGQWISFAVLLPAIFGLAFQMPLVMLFVERIGIIEVKDLREKRPIAIMVMAVVSAFLTPQDPITLLLMLFPLMLLYELGIFMCLASPKRAEFLDVPT